MTKGLAAKVRKIKVLALDVDGVLTDGRINLDEKGKEIKSFDVHDGFGLAMFRRAGGKIAIITARSSGAVTARAKDLKFDCVFQDAYPKTGAFQSLLKKLKVKPEEVCFVGDDLPDLCILKQAGLAVGVSNAVADVKKQADYVTKAKGGRGAVREVIEFILKTQKKWKEVFQHYAG